jgi:predicted metal-dependent HD superfamily phosphohydrolase
MKKNLQHQLFKQIKKHVLDCFKEADTDKLLYHNKDHTLRTVDTVFMLADHYQLNDHDYAIVVAAAWFHDLGYLYVREDHEIEGARLAEKFLLKKKVSPDDIEAVIACMLATKVPQSAVNLNDQILCDADLFDLGTDDFFKNDKLLRKESILLNNRDISKPEWQKNSIHFLEQHAYYTEYCRSLLDEKKAEHLVELRKKLSEGEPGDTAKTHELKTETTGGKLNGPAKADKRKDKPEKGIETMFRISSANHQRLSDMADKKAHIMITVNSIILSAIISLVLRKLDDYGFLVIPSFILLAVSLMAMTFSILSTRPSVPHGIFSQHDLDEKRVNLLFFGNFYKMQLAQYTAGMRMMMEDGDFLYGSLIRDGFAQGVVLGKKYHLLRISYSVFMYGLILAVAAFMLAYLVAGHDPAPAVPVPVR